MIALATVLALGSSVPPSGAAVINRTWDGGGTTNNWSNGSNWDGNTDVGLNGTDSIVFSALGAARLTTNVQNLAGLSIAGLTYNANAGNSTIGGPESITILEGGINNASGFLQTIAAPVIVGGSQIWNGGTGGLNLSGGVTFAALSPARAVSITGTITLGGGITNASANLQTVTGAVRILQGQTWDRGAGGLSVGGITFASGAIENALGMSGSGAFVSTGNIVNASDRLQRIAAPITVGADQTWDGGPGGLVFTGPIVFAEGSLARTVTTTGSIIFEGGVSNGSANLQTITGPVRIFGAQTWNTGTGGLSVSGLTLASGAASSTFTLAGSGGLSSKGDIVNDTGQAQTLAAPISVGADQTWNGGTGGLVLAGRVVFASGSPARTVTSIGSITLGGGITNAGAELQTISGPVRILGAQTWDRGAGGLSVGGITFANGAVANALTLLGNGPFLSTGSIVNESGNAQTLAASVTLAANQTWDGGTVGLTFQGIPTLGNNTLTLNNVRIDAAASLLAVGFVGPAELAIRSGSRVNTANGYIGINTGSRGNVEITGTGSTWTISNLLYVGAFAPGALTISNGGSANTGGGQLGGDDSGEGIVTVTGSGSRLDIGTNLDIAVFGSGVLDISQGGVVRGVSSRIGNFASSSGIVNVTGTGSTWENTASVSVGVVGSATLNIGSGGLVIVGGNLAIGSKGMVNLVDGTLQAGNAFSNSGGMLNWTGGTLRLMNAFSLGAGVLGGVTTLLPGMALEAGTSFAVGAGNQLVLAGGTLGGTGVLRNDGFLSGFGTITGSGGFSNDVLLVQNGGNLVLANTGANTNNGNWDLAAGFQLQLATATTLTNNGFLNLNGGQVGGTGTLVNAVGGVIGGRGAISSAFSNAGAIAVDSGTTSITRAFTNNGQIQLSSNTALLTGGSLNNSGRIEGLGRVGNAVTNNGTVEAIGGTLTFAGGLTNTANGVIAAGSGSRVLVTAGLASNAGQIQLSGGTFDNNGGGLTNAATGIVSGFGTLRGGTLTNDGRVLLSGGTSAVRANVISSNNSQIVLSGASNTTFYGTVEIRSGAELRVSEGSVATFFGQVNQRNGALFTGTGAKLYEGGLAVGNSPGLGIDSGSVTFGAANVYEAEIGGTNPGDAQGVGIAFDRYVVGGTLTFGGTLRVVRYGGFAPQAGQSFDLFDWGTARGQFATIDFSTAPLSGGLVWDTSRLYTDGTLSVAAVPEPGSYAMFAAGLGLMGFMVRRRKATTAAA